MADSVIFQNADFFITTTTTPYQVIVDGHPVTKYRVGTSVAIHNKTKKADVPGIRAFMGEKGGYLYAVLDCPMVGTLKPLPYDLFRTGLLSLYPPAAYIKKISVTVDPLGSMKHLPLAHRQWSADQGANCMRLSQVIFAGELTPIAASMGGAAFSALHCAYQDLFPCPWVSR